MIKIDDIFLYAVSSLGALVLMWCVTEFKRPKWQIAIVFSSGFLITFITQLIACYFFEENYYVYYTLIGLVSAFVLIGGMIYISTDPWYKIFFQVVTQVNCLLILITIGTAISERFNESSWADGITRLAGIIVLILIYKLFFKKVFRGFVNEYDRPAGWFGFTALSLGFLVLFLVEVYVPEVLFDRPSSYMHEIIFYVTTFVYALAFLSIVAGLRGIVLLKNANEEVKESELKMEYWQGQIVAQDEVINQTRKLRHDLRHHNSVLLGYLENNQIDKAKEYLEKVSAAVENMSLKTYCKNYTVNCILASYINAAQNNGIKVMCSADIPEDIKIDELDLTALFANLIENATEACQRIKDPNREKYIEVSVEHTNNNLKILIRNSSNGDAEFNGTFPITKKPGSRAIGTKSIAQIAQKYDGMYSFEEHNREFISKIILAV